LTHIAQRSPSTVRHLANGGTRIDFDDFVRARLHSLIRYATLLTGSREIAEDTVQEALIKAHVTWKRISAMERPEPYVKRIVTNVFLSSTRRRLLRTVELQAAHTDVATVDRPPSHEQTTADRAALLAEISQLPRQQRAVLVLRFYEGLSDSEIAEILGCRVGTVRGYGSRALAALRLELDVWRTADGPLKQGSEGK